MKSNTPKLRRIVLGLFCLVMLSDVFAQPANDSCSRATIISVLPYNDLGDNSNATASIGEPNPTCASYMGADVWYEFTPVNAGNYYASCAPDPGSAIADMGMEVYTGACGSLTMLACDDDSGEGAFPALLMSLGSGAKIYIRAWVYANNASGTFNLNLMEMIAPSNDECVNAIALPVSSTTVCNTTVSGSIFAATASTENNSCPAQAEFDDDVWFSFLASNTSHIVNVENQIGGIDDLVFQVIDGVCQANPLQLICQLRNRFRVDGLVIGQLYFVRVASAGTYLQNISFDICVQTPPAPPVNDDCTQPVSVPVSITENCTNKISGTITGATASQQNSCSPALFNDDVWFTFTALDTTHVIELSNFQGDFIEHVVQVTENSCAINAIELICIDRSVFKLNQLVVNQDYLIRIASSSSGYEEFSFEICIRTPSPPTNDECVDAIFVPASDVNCTTTTFCTTKGATGSPESSSCVFLVFGEDFDDDSWLYFQASSTTHVIEILNIFGTTADLVFEVYGGACNNLTSIDCFDQPNNRFDVSGLQVGTNYYIRIASYEDIYHEISFDICIRDPILLSNDECSGALPLPISTGGSCGSQLAGSFEDATTSSNDPSCLFAQDVWYSFVAQQSQQRIDVENLGLENIRLGYQLLRGDCQALTSIECGDVAASQPTTRINLGNLMVDSSYLLKLGYLENAAMAFSDFTICAKGVMLPCSTLVSTTAAVGPGSLREAIHCAGIGDEITFAPTLNGQTIELDLPEIVIDKQLKFLADFSDGISISNFDANNASRLLFIENALTIEGLKIEGKNADSMLWEIATGGSLDVIDGELILVTVEK